MTNIVRIQAENQDRSGPVGRTGGEPDINYMAPRPKSLQPIHLEAIGQKGSTPIKQKWKKREKDDSRIGLSTGNTRPKNEKKKIKFPMNSQSTWKAGWDWPGEKKTLSNPRTCLKKYSGTSGKKPVLMLWFHKKIETVYDLC